MAKFWIPKLLGNGKLISYQGGLTGYFDNIKTIGDHGLYSAFWNCTGITGGISFPNLTSIGSDGLYSAFDGCIGITGGISFPNLTTIGDWGFQYAFRGCTGITGGISFPNLTTIGDWGLYNAFWGCTGITEIHFRTDAKNVVESTDGYSSKFGASNATIYFDL